MMILNKYDNLHRKNAVLSNNAFSHCAKCVILLYFSDDNVYLDVVLMWQNCCVNLDIRLFAHLRIG